MSRVRPGGHGEGDGNADDNRDSTDMLGTEEAQRRAAYRSYLGGDSARLNVTPKGREVRLQPIQMLAEWRTGTGPSGRSG